MVEMDLQKQDPSHQADDLERQRTRQSTLQTDTEDLEPIVTGADGMSLVLDWDSPEDPDNPHNWTTLMKLFQTLVPALYCFVLTIGSSTYVPAIPMVMQEFQVSRSVAILPISMYVVGYIFGPLIAAPISELYGRRNVYWTTIPLLLIFTSVAASANSIEQLIIARFFAGMGGSAALAIGAGTVTDIWNDKKSVGQAGLAFIIAPFLGPSLGTLTGAYIISQYDNNWRWGLWVIMIICAPIALMVCFLRETSRVRILLQREQKRGVKVQHQEGDTKILIHKLRRAIARPVKMLFVEPLVAALGVYTSFAFAMMFSFFGSYNYVFQSVYHFNQKEVGLTFIGITIGFILGAIVFGAFDATLYTKAIARAPNGSPEPEHRLYAAMFGSVLLPAGLFWFAWAPAKDVHWIVPVLAGVPFGCGCFTIFLSSVIYLIDVYGSEFGASALAATGILRFLFCGAFPLFTLQMYEGLGIHWAGSVFGFIALAMLPVPWVFFKWGKGLRERSTFVPVLSEKN